MSYSEYSTIVDGFRKRQVEELKIIRWQTWQIIRHNAFLKNPPANPQKLLKFDDEIQADDEKINSAVQRLKEAHGRRGVKSQD